MGVDGRMSDLGKLLIALGLVLLVGGVVVLLLGRANLPLGRLPGDLFIAESVRRFIFRWRHRY